MGEEPVEKIETKYKKYIQSKRDKLNRTVGSLLNEEDIRLLCADGDMYHQRPLYQPS